MAPTPIPVEIPLAGNAFITKKYSQDISGADVGSNGLGNWQEPETVCSVYFKAETGGQFFLAIRFKVAGGTSNVSISYGDKNYNVPLEGDSYHDQDVGSFEVKEPGYIKINIQGHSKTGTWFGDISYIILKTHDLGEINYASDPNEFQWSIRGPSMDITYEDYPRDSEYFYGEITVPDGEDSVGAYFMVNGFDGGYFGIQTNNFKRTVLFSIWSAYTTDNPSAIPSDYAVRCLKTGEGNKVEAFGGEGAGSHTNFDYFWKSGITYKFLLRGAPLKDEDASKFTGWFGAPELGWHLMSTYIKPKIKTYLNGMYSFSEGLGDTSYIERKAYYGNQWCRDPSGKWSEITKMGYEDPDKYQSRKDRICGAVKDQFFIKNMGFFNETVAVGASFTREPVNKPPEIDFVSLGSDIMSESETRPAPPPLTFDIQ